MLLGRYRSKLFEKGRLAFPAKLRSELGESIVITQGYEKSLIVVSSKSWKELIAGTGERPFIHGAARDTTRFLLGSAQIINLDKQGRFVLPTHLRGHAKIGSEAMFLGLGKYVEIWDSLKWEKYQKKIELNIEDIAEKLGKINTRNE